MQRAPSTSRNTASTDRSALARRAAFAGLAALVVGVAATASGANGDAGLTPSLAELLGDGFAISAMSQSAIGGGVTIALQRDDAAFLCEVERGETAPAKACQPLAAGAYLADWRQRRTAEAREAERIANEDLIAALNATLAEGDRRCAFDLQQVIDEAVWSYQQKGGDSADAADRIKGWLLGRSGLRPLGDPSENILQSTIGDACAPGLADERLAEIRAARGAESVIRNVFAEFEGCVVEKEALSAALDARVRTAPEPEAMKLASRRMFKRGAVRDDSVAGLPHFRLTKGCP